MRADLSSGCRPAAKRLAKRPTEKAISETAEWLARSLFAGTRRQRDRQKIQRGAHHLLLWWCCRYCWRCCCAVVVLWWCGGAVAGECSRLAGPARS